MVSYIQHQPKRLVVILPEDLAGNLKLANKIHWIARREQREVVYLALVDDLDKMLSKSRSMATMVAVTGGNILEAGSKLVPASDWLQTLREICQPEDVIVCQAEQAVRKGLTGVHPLAEYIHSAFKNRIMVMTGYYKPVRERLNRLAGQLLFTLGFLIIFALFTTLEIVMDRTFQGTFRTLLLCAIVSLEFGAVYAWNNLLSR